MSETNQVQAELKRIVTNLSNDLADDIPKQSYMGFSLYTKIVPAILGELTNFVLPQSSVTGPAWNYIDAACTAVTGVNQLLDDKNHRPVATKIKGAVNIGSSAQLFTLTALNFSLFGGPAFAAAFGVGFLLSLDETARAFARKYNFGYWLKDSLAQLEKLNTLKQELENEIVLLELAMDMTGARWAIKRKQERLNEMEDKIKKLEKDIFFRVSAKRFENSFSQNQSDTVIAEQLKNTSEAFKSTAFAQDLLEINNWHNKDEIILNRKDLISELEKAKKPIVRLDREQEIMKDCDKHVVSAVKDSFIWGVAFVGMLLLCIPGCQLPGLAIVGIASALYLAKNIDKFTSAVKKGYHYFFNSSEQKDANNKGQVSDNQVDDGPKKPFSHVVI